ncbi:MAG: SDR family oxidoreductase [Elusimicrobia bacterium]|nr:SDR family oxidoreductase [Elusimicrobiota bacterium]
MSSLEGKVVIITGASSGIGRSAALKFAEEGAKLVLAARRAGRLEEIRQQIAAYNAECIAVKADVSREEDVRNLFDETEKVFGAPDILVNNAGRGLKAEIRDIGLDEWMSVLNTNLTGVFLCTREFVRRKKDSPSIKRIITVSSIAGLFGAPTYAAYCASKHAVTGFNRSARWELSRKGIKVTVIHPARVDTEFFDSYKKRPGRAQMLSPSDIAELITAIASGSAARAVLVRGLNFFKRVYYLARYTVIPQGEKNEKNIP